jgi:hypothetical protein
MKSGEDIGANVASGIGFGVISLLESVADGIMGATPPPKPRRAEPARTNPNPFDALAHEARQQREREQEEGDSEWRKRQRSYGE